jgi:hypothetical protein
MRCRRLRSAAVTRLSPRGIRSRRPHSSLISGPLGLEGISKRKDSHCRSGRGGGLLKSRTQTCAAVRREAEEDLGR